MRKFGIGIVVLTTWYLAGIYRYKPLMILGVMEVILILAMFVLSRYLKSTLAVSMAVDTDSVTRGSKYRCGVLISNRGNIPVSRFKIDFLYGYIGEEQEHEKVYGGTGHGGQRLAVELDCPHNGLAAVSAEDSKIYDYLSIFGSKKSLNRQTMVEVYPKDIAARIILTSLQSVQHVQVTGSAMVPQAGGNDEIRQLREYRDGDSIRYVHWNLSARMEDLWIREYETERDVPLQFYVDREGIEDAPFSETDGFYDVLSSLLLGLMQETPWLRVWWRGISEGPARAIDLRDASQVREVVRSLYFEQLGEPETAPLNGEPDKAAPMFSLNRKLDWKLDGQLIWHFSEKDYEKEIGTKVFDI